MVCCWKDVEQVPELIRRCLVLANSPATLIGVPPKSVLRFAHMAAVSCTWRRVVTTHTKQLVAYQRSVIWNEADRAVYNMQHAWKPQLDALLASSEWRVTVTARQYMHAFEVWEQEIVFGPATLSHVTKALVKDAYDAVDDPDDVMNMDYRADTILLPSAQHVLRIALRVTVAFLWQLCCEADLGGVCMADVQQLRADRLEKACPLNWRLCSQATTSPPVPRIPEASSLLEVEVVQRCVKEHIQAVLTLAEHCSTLLVTGALAVRAFEFESGASGYDAHFEHIIRIATEELQQNRWSWLQRDLSAARTEADWLGNINSCRLDHYQGGCLCKR